MASELDDFLNSHKEEQNKKQQAQGELWRRQKEFIAAFKKSLDTIIHPSMVNIIGKLRKQKSLTMVLSERRKKSNPMTHIKGYDVPPKLDAKGRIFYRHYENYYISGKPMAQGFGMILTVMGNYQLQKVCVFAEYIKHINNAPSTSLKKTEQQFDLPQITPELFDKIVTQSLKEMVAISQSPPEGMDTHNTANAAE